MNEDGTVRIDNSKCISCGACVYQCPFGAIVDKSFILDAVNLIKGSQSVEVAVAEGSSNDLSTSVSESIQSATIIFATLPILIVYPFVQRYFVAGVTMGAVKG